MNASRRRAARHLAPVALALLALAGCSGPSYADLAKIAHTVPVPAGLTPAGADKFTNQAFPNGTKEVDLLFDNPHMTCDQLRTAWTGALRKAHRSFHAQPSSSQIWINDVRGAIVNIDIGGVMICTHPFVTVQEKP